MDVSKLKPLKGKLCVYRGDITKLKADAIVNAANKTLLGGGGVDGAIHRAAGPELKAYCAKLHGCATGEAKITPGFNLPSKYIIHTVGPIGEKPHLLKSCYYNCMNIAEKKKCKSIVFCCISTGIYGYPNAPAAKIAISTVQDWLNKHPLTSIQRIVFCCFLLKDVLIYQKILSN